LRTAVSYPPKQEDNAFARDYGDKKPTLKVDEGANIGEKDEPVTIDMWLSGERRGVDDTWVNSMSSLMEWVCQVGCVL
jgi:hypothetical protein